MSNMSHRLEIKWTPVTNKFITWGSEVCLYETGDNTEGLSHTVKISKSLYATKAATNLTHLIKCVDVYPQQPFEHDDILIAIGQTGGKIVLTTFGTSAYDSQGVVGREFIPRYTRPCNALAWNPIETSKIVSGLEKHRSDYSILLWDTMVCNGLNEGSSTRFGMEHMRPITEYGSAESTHSLAWFQGNSKVLAAGMNLKAIKLIDFRDTNKVAGMTATKAVYGVCMDPHNDRHIASYIDNQIYIWDTRNFEKPILSLPHTKSLLKILWCPTKHNLLGALQRDSTTINLYDLQHTVIGNEEVEPSVLERIITPGNLQNISSFSWHESDENRLLAVSTSGAMSNYTVYDRITLNWAANSNVVWTFGRKTMKFFNKDSNFYNHLDDISLKIKERAIKGYGLTESLSKNCELVDDEMLVNVWTHLHLSEMLVATGILKGSTSKHPGVREVLKLELAANKSEVISTNFSDVGCNNTARIYRHEDRDKALHLCGWVFDKDHNGIAKFLNCLVEENAYTRAAAIAVFNLKIRLAIDILNQGAEKSENLNIVAMALAGFSDDKNSMWRQFCSSPKMKLNDPYLRAMFAFLTAENFNYDNVLNETEISVDDRIAFACIFLNDLKLLEFLKTLTCNLMLLGNLDGLLLTGNTPDGIKLLQRYLDITGDIQTVALVAVRAFSTESMPEIQDWITSYRSLLDSWQLWNERALFDIMFTSQRPNDKPQQQVYVSCNFCGKSISAYMQGINRGRGQYSRMGGTSNKLKMSSCPHCRKPLPRCVICLMHMGTLTGGYDTTEMNSNKLVDFANWFTWCQTCRHGGHASHMIHWFKEHSECPVTACTCRCFAVDSVSSTVPK